MTDEKLAQSLTHKDLLGVVRGLGEKEYYNPSLQKALFTVVVDRIDDAIDALTKAMRVNRDISPEAISELNYVRKILKGEVK